jgi:hypothetical protein
MWPICYYKTINWDKIITSGENLINFLGGVLICVYKVNLEEKSIHNFEVSHALEIGLSRNKFLDLYLKNPTLKQYNQLVKNMAYYITNNIEVHIKLPICGEKLECFLHEGRIIEGNMRSH